MRQPDLYLPYRLSGLPNHPIFSPFPAKFIFGESDVIKHLERIVLFRDITRHS